MRRLRLGTYFCFTEKQKSIMKEGIIMKKIALLLAFVTLLLTCACFTSCESWEDEYCKYVHVTSSISGNEIKYYSVRDIVNAETVEELVIPVEYDGLPVGGIEEGAFKDCVKLKKVTLPASIISIDSGIFNGCTTLEEVVILAKELNNRDVGSVFKGVGTAEKPVTVKIGKDVSIIPQSLFKDAANVKIEYDATNTSITVEDYAFTNTAIKNLTVPSSASKIGYEAYKNSGIKSVQLKASGTLQISEKAFADCETLTTVDITVSSENVQSSWIKASVFDGCTQLKEINFSGTQEEWNHMFKVGMSDKPEKVGAPSGYDFKVICSDGEIEYKNS